MKCHSQYSLVTQNSTKISDTYAIYLVLPFVYLIMIIKEKYQGVEWFANISHLSDSFGGDFAFRHAPITSVFLARHVSRFQSFDNKFL